MADRYLTADIIATSAIDILENTCVMGDLVYRGLEEDFDKKVNGYDVGETLSVKRPMDFTVRTGNVASVQGKQEGKFTVSVDQQIGVDFELTSVDRTLKIGAIEERIIKPAMIQIGNYIDAYLAGLWKQVWNYSGEPGSLINSYDDFSKAPALLTKYGVPLDGRNAILSPDDARAMRSQQTGLYMQDVAKEAYRTGKLGMIANCETYESQNVQSQTAGTRDNTTPLTRGTSNTTTWDASKDTGTMVLSTDGWDNSATIEEGMVFTIADVYGVNSVTKARLPNLQTFVVRSAVTAAASSSNETQLTISPPIITSGAYQTVDSAPGNDKAITVYGAASGVTAQNMIFRQNAFALVMVPMVKPSGNVEFSRKSYKGYSVRVIHAYDVVNDKSICRIDALFGAKVLDGRQAVRFAGFA